MRISLLALFFALVSCASYAQNRNVTFHEFVADFDLYKSETTHIYNEVDWTFRYRGGFWSSLSNDIRLTTPIGDWMPYVGCNVRYVYQTELNAQNYLEVRPWMGIEYRRYLIPDLSFMERMRIELRNFNYFSNRPREVYGRVRNKVNLEWYFFRSRKNNSSWTINTSYEWYFLRSPAYDEQYSNSREFKTGINWRMKKGYKLTFLYQQNLFLLGNNKTEDQGSSFTIEFDF